MCSSVQTQNEGRRRPIARDEIGDPEVVKTNPTKVMASFCHHIFFLESPETGAEWAAQHGEGTFLVTLEEAFALGKQLNYS